MNIYCGAVMYKWYKDHGVKVEPITEKTNLLRFIPKDHTFTIEESDIKKFVETEIECWKDHHYNFEIKILKDLYEAILNGNFWYKEDDKHDEKVIIIIKMEE